MPESDILREIPFQDILKLKDLYKEHLNYAPYVYNTLNTAIKWNKSRPDKKYFTIYVPNGEWRSDGTFIALMQWGCYDLFVFTLDKSCKRLYKALKETSKINWKNHITFYGLHNDHREAVLKAMKEINVPIIYESETKYWCLKSDKAAQLTFKCPDEYYIQTLKPDHAFMINDLWPHKYEGSLDYVSTFIEMNGGHGIFRKTDNKLVSWILRCQMGIALLQTLNEHKREGLGILVTKSLCKEMGLEGLCPTATIHFSNEASQKLVKSLGFEILHSNSFVGVGNPVHKSHL